MATPDGSTILVVDDEAAVREVLALRLRDWGYGVELAADGAAARAVLDRARPDLVISDVVLPDASGLELLDLLRGPAPGRPVILITAFGSIDAAVEAMKRGALDFLTKPLDYGKLRSLLTAAERRLERQRETTRLERRLRGSPGVGGLIGTSRAMREVQKLVRIVAASEASVILTGESGTGKEVAAQAIHRLSSRSAAPLVAINTAALPEGLVESELFGHQAGAFTGATTARPGCFEMADGGILFLDEIAEMPVALQPRFLRVLEDGLVRRLGGRREIAVDVRVLAATHRDPLAAVEEGLLRADLFYRLNVFTVELPPLRARLEDLALLAQHFISSFNDKHRVDVAGVSAEALDLMGEYHWPGNVRELRNVMERAMILAREGWIESVHLPPFLRDGSVARRRGIVLPPDVTASEAERIVVLETLAQCGDNKSEAARRLGVDVKTVRNKLRAYGRAAGRK
ncbi:MAG: sigma-54 dependent transcriptional regulator [Acidobacteriota bacterium]|nr:sigma-54 dependent transcriptional regulator [Acidobacteriota bacterium]MDH3522282.1 sigma-54 dependent transcriptional regulator [Acidobacteriota bacterium]